MRQRLSKISLKAERGFTMVIVIGVMLVGTLLVAAAFASSDGDTTITRHDQYYKQAYDAAEAGVAYYLAHLNQNTNYWSNCYTSPIQSPGTAYSTSSSQAIPNSEARYEIELLKAPNYSGACSSTASASVIDPSTGQLAIRSTGYYRGVKRSVIGTFKRDGFLNYLWFTNFETPDPLAAGTSSSCAEYHRDGRASNCGDQQFINGEPDQRSRAYQRRVLRLRQSHVRPCRQERQRRGHRPGRLPAMRRLSPTFNGTTTWGAPNLQMPTTNAALKSYADSTSIFTGPVHITITSSGARVVSSSGTVLQSGTTYPPAGIIYVQNGTCSTSFSAGQGYPSGGGCGDAWVHSTTDSAADLTIAAENDVIIDGDLTHRAPRRCSV